MQTVTEILGGAQTLLPLSFDIQRCFEEYLTNEHRCFLSLLRVIEEAQPRIAIEAAKTGRPAYQNEPIMRAFLARNFFRIPTVTDLRNRLLNDPNLRKICDFDVVPSPATFSRRLKDFSEGPLMVQTLNAMVKEHHEGRIVGHISRDSTAIAARETPVNRKRDVASAPAKPKRKRGRPRKGEVRPAKEPTQIEVQLKRSARASLSKLSKSCAWGCKKNSQGNVSTWKGYKLHLDVSDIGFPITAIVTGANVHDSQAAIPMEKLTGRKVQHLYSLMDAAYDADAISTYIKEQGRVPLIDPNKRRGPERVPFSPAQKQRFKIRTTVERANAHLKDWLIPTQIFVRGFEKVSFLLMCGVLCLAAIKALQYFILPELQEA
jgi:transposase